MSAPPSLQTNLAELLAMAQATYPDLLNYDQTLGALVSCLSVPDALTPADILDLVLNGEEDAAEVFLAANPTAEVRWQEVINQLRDQLKADEFYLPRLYPQIDGEPSQPLADWCDGYLQAYFYCESIWQEVFKTLKEMEDGADLADIEENHGLLLNMVSSFSNWKEALLSEPVLADIAENMVEIHADLFNGVNYYFLFGQDMVSTWETISQESAAPFVKAETPGRNDPCICGSGKKYKKCCLN